MTDLTTRLERLIQQLPREHEATLREAIGEIERLQGDLAEMTRCAGFLTIESKRQNHMIDVLTAQANGLTVRKAAGLGPEGGE